jgi:chaperonin GroES
MLTRTSSTLKASRKRVIVTPLDIPQSTLITIPDVARKRATQGIVKSVGIDVEDIQVGDRVVFTQYAGTELEIEREGETDEIEFETVLSMAGEDILAVIDSPA